jgi:hypothetical protein
MNEPLINEASVRKILETVDAGLAFGLGAPEPGKMCVEAAVCYGLGLPHNDDPGCVSPAVRALKIRLNDSNWSSPAARAAGLRRLAIVQLGTKGTIDEVKFAMNLATLSRSLVGAQKPVIIDSYVNYIGGYDAAFATSYSVAFSAAKAAATADFVATHAEEVLSATNRAHYAAAAAERNALSIAAISAPYSTAAAAQAASAAAIAAYAISDKILSDFAEGVVQVLISLGAPGAEYLFLTEAQ